MKQRNEKRNKNTQKAERTKGRKAGFVCGTLLAAGLMLLPTGAHSKDKAPASKECSHYVLSTDGAKTLRARAFEEVMHNKAQLRHAVGARSHERVLVKVSVDIDKRGESKVQKVTAKKIQKATAKTRNKYVDVTKIIEIDTRGIILDVHDGACKWEMRIVF